MNDEIYIISWCFRFSDSEDRDYWQVRETLQEAKDLYNDVIQVDATYAASISAVVQSTDYDIHPKLNEVFDETNQTSSAKPA